MYIYGMKYGYEHIAEMVASCRYCAVPPPSLNNLYIEALHSPAPGGAFGVVFNYSTSGGSI